MDQLEKEQKILPSFQKIFILRSLSIRRTILSPPIMVHQNLFKAKPEHFCITNYEKVQISISEPKIFSRLCTFKRIMPSFSVLIPCSVGCKVKRDRVVVKRRSYPL